MGSDQEECTITDYFEMVELMLARGVHHLLCHHVDHHVSWSKVMGLVGWSVWLVKTDGSGWSKLMGLAGQN